MPGLSSREKSVVEVIVKPEVKPEEIAELVARIGGLVGCRACGLLGVDVRLFAEDPEILKVGPESNVGGIAVSPA